MIFTSYKMDYGVNSSDESRGRTEVCINNEIRRQCFMVQTLITWCKTKIKAYRAAANYGIFSIL